MPISFIKRELKAFICLVEYLLDTVNCSFKPVIVYINHITYNC